MIFFSSGHGNDVVKALSVLYTVAALSLLGYLAFTYAFLLAQLNDVKPDEIKFYVDNQCSDMLVNFSFNEVYNDLAKIFTMTYSGIVISLFGFVLQIVIMLKTIGKIDKHEE